MNKKIHVTITQKIWFLSFLFSLLVLIVGGIAEINTIVLSKALQNITSVHLVTTANLIKIDMMHDGLAAKVYKSLEYATQKNQKELSSNLKETQEMSETIARLIEETEKLDISETAKAAISETENPLKEYIRITNEIVTAANKLDRVTALEFVPAFEEKFSLLEASLERVGNILEGEAQKTIAEEISFAGKAENINLAVIISGCIFGFLMSLWFVRDIFKQLSSVAQSLKFESAHMSETAEQIARSSTSLNTSTASQSAAIEETVASMEEMSSMIAMSNSSIDSTAKESKDALKIATKGKEDVSSLVKSMHAISQTNSKLKSIEQVIDDIKRKTAIINDIAFETKLLAFNASIEAARAGVHGRGFSVVAEEVGKLANVSNKAADEVRNLLENSLSGVSGIIEETNHRINDGEQATKACQQSFDSMEKAFVTISEGLGRIAQATKEQSIGINQTNQAMNNMERVAQANLRESENLSAQATQMQEASCKLKASSNLMESLVFSKKFNLTSSTIHESESTTKATLNLSNEEASIQPNNNPETPHRDDSRWTSAS